MKVSNRRQSLNSQQTDGIQKQNEMQNSTASLKTDGRKSIPIWTRQRDAEIQETLDALKEFQGSLAYKARKEFEEASRAGLAESKLFKQRVGAKQKLSDIDALYLRRESKTKSVASLCRELKISKKTAENCIKGITYKHLDVICAPQI